MGEWQHPAGLIALMRQPGVGAVEAIRRAADGNLDGLDERALRRHRDVAQEMIAAAHPAWVRAVGFFDHARRRKPRPSGRG